MNSDHSNSLAEQIRHAYEKKNPLCISGGGSKAFYGSPVEGETLSLKHHCGIIDYEASELVITARAGTPVSEVETALARNNQKLPFEPPRHSDASTLGGVIACAMSGPSRAFYGAARDYVLGAGIVNGRGELLEFGGQVMKNVAGYDISRLMVGAQGTLGVILKLSIKILPAAEVEATRCLETDISTAHWMLHDWIQRGHPVTASCYTGGCLHLRLSGTENSVRQASDAIGGEAADDALWKQLRDQTHPLFEQDNLWRLSVPRTAAFHDDDALIEWGGALRWRRSEIDLFDEATAAGGHATRYAIHGNGLTRFQPLPEGLMTLHRRIKARFDPENILNPGRLYPGL